MAKRDVDLVIRAKNEASKAVDSISASLRGLITVQESLEGSAKSTDSTLTRLRGALGALDSQFRGMSATQKIAADLDKSRTAMERLEASTAELRVEAQRFAQEAQQATSATDRMSAAANEAGTALQREKGLMAQLGAEQKKLNAAVASAISRRDQLAARDARITAQIDKQTASVSKAVGRYGELEAAVRSAATPSNTLVERTVRASAAIAKQETALERLNAKLTQNRAQMGLVTGIINHYQAEIASLNGSIAIQSGFMDRLGAEHKTLALSVQASARSQGEAVAAASRVDAALAREEAQVLQLKAGFETLSATAAEANAKMNQIATSIGARLTVAMQRLDASMTQTKVRWRAMTQEAALLAVEMRKTAVPSEQLVAAFNGSVAAAQKAKLQYTTQRQALAEMGVAYRNSVGDIDAATGASREFIAIQERLSASLGEIRGRSEQAAASERQLAGSAQQAASGQQRVATTTRAAGEGMGVLAVRSRSAAESVRLLGNSSRAAMSWTQRLRSEVLSLVAAYGGIFGAVQGIRNVLEATQLLQAAQNRLGVITGGDTGKAAEELDFVRRAAERLGIEFGILANQYTIFASSTLGTNIEGEKTRKIFIAVAEAARVNGSSMDDVQAVFKALGQIASKGNLQMEELRGQLGDRMPAALKLMADGLGLTVGELQDMTKQGQISSDALLPFAEELTRRYGPQLAEALGKTTAKIGMLAVAGQQGLLRIGESGFIEAFNDLLDRMTEFLTSAQGLSVLENIGTALAGLTNAIAFVVTHIQGFTVAAVALLAVRFVPTLVSWAAGTKLFTAALNAVKIGLLATEAQMASMTVTAAKSSGALGKLSAVAAGLKGGIVGLALTAVATGLAIWFTRTKEATSAMEDHQRTVDAVKNSYDLATGAATSFANAVENTSFAQATTQMDAVGKAVLAARDALLEFVSDSVTPLGVDPGDLPLRRRLADMIRELGNTGNFDKFKEETDKLFKEVSADSPLRVLITDAQDLATKGPNAFQKLTEAYGRMRVIVSTFGQTIEARKTALDNYERSLNKTADTLDKAAEAQEKLKNTLSASAGSTDEAKRIIDELKDAYDGVGDTAEKAMKRLGGAVTRQEITRTLQGLNEVLAKSKKEITEFASVMDKQKLLNLNIDVDSQPFIDQINTMVEQFAKGDLSAAAFKERLSEIGLATEDAGLQKFTSDIQSMINRLGGDDGVLPLIEAMEVALIAMGENKGTAKVALEALKMGASYGEAAEKIREAGVAVDGLSKKQQANLRDAIKDAQNLGGVIKRAAEGFRDFGEEGETVNRHVRRLVDGVNTVETAAGEAERKMERMGIKAGDSADAAATGSERLTSNLRTIRQSVLDVGAAYNETGEDLRQSFDAQPIDNVVAAAGRAKDATEATQASTRTAAQENIELSRRYVEQIEAARESYARMGEDFEGQPDPFGVLRRSAEEAKIKADALGLSIEEYNAQLEASKLLFSIIDPGGMLGNAQKQAILAGQSLNEYQLKLLEAKAALEGVPAESFLTFMTAQTQTVVTGLVSLRTEVEGVASALAAVSSGENGILPNAEAEAAVAQQAIAGIEQSLQDLLAQAPQTQDAFSGIAPAVGSEFDALANTVERLISRLKAQLASLRAQIAAAQRAAASAKSSEGSGKAGGGRIFGRGTSTSDSVNIRASRDEYMVKAKAARHYGYGFMRMINDMLIPKNLLRPGYAGGGRVQTGGAPASMDLGPLMSKMSSAGSLRPANIYLPGIAAPVQVMASDEVLDKLALAARRQQMSSAGVAPSWEK